MNLRGAAREAEINTAYKQNPAYEILNKLYVLTKRAVARLLFLSLCLIILDKHGKNYYNINENDYQYH